MLALPRIVGSMPVHGTSDNRIVEFNKNRGQAKPAPDIAKCMRRHEIASRRYFTQQLPAVQHEPVEQQPASHAQSPPLSQAQPRSLQTQFSHLQSMQQSHDAADAEV